MKAILRCCSPCCLRAEPEEKPRVKVSYSKATSPKQAPEESVALLKPEEQQDTVNKNGDTVKEKDDKPSDPNQNDDNNKENNDQGDGEIIERDVEYTDVEGKKVKRIVKKTETTATTKTTSVADESPKKLTREILENTKNKPNSREEEETEVVEYVDKDGRRVRRRIVKKIVTTTVSTKKGSNENGSKPESPDAHESSDSYNSVDKRTVVTKTIGGGENRSVVERSTTSSQRDDEDPIMVVKKDRQIDVPGWMEARKSPQTQHKNLDTSDISIHLKYPRNDAQDTKEPEEKAKESEIRPEVENRDKPNISILSLEEVVKQSEKEKPEVKETEEEMQEASPKPTSADDREDESEYEDEDKEYDEFEEEIVIIEVNRKYRYPKGLVLPKPEPEKVGIPIEDLLEIPTVQVEQESDPNEKLLIEEETIERSPTIFYEPDRALIDEM